MAKHFLIVKVKILSSDITDKHKKKHIITFCIYIFIIHIALELTFKYFYKYKSICLSLFQSSNSNNNFFLVINNAQTFPSKVEMIYIWNFDVETLSSYGMRLKIIIQFHQMHLWKKRFKIEFTNTISACIFS